MDHGGLQARTAPPERACALHLHLDQATPLGEIPLGLIMTLTVTLSAGVIIEYTLSRPWLAGTAFFLCGLILVAAAIALGE